MCDTYIDSQFLGTATYLWEKSVLNQVFKILKDQKGSKTSEECFLKLKTELTNSVHAFLEQIRVLKLISNCRVKGDNTSKFGGTECAALAKKIRASCEKYMKETKYKSEREGSLFSFISLIRNKAKEDELSAADIEKRLRNNYKESGKDDSLLYIQKCGYDFNNLNFKDIKGVD